MIKAWIWCGRICVGPVGGGFLDLILQFATNTYRMRCYESKNQRLFISVSSCRTYKRQSSMLRFIALWWVLAPKNIEHSQGKENVIKGSEQFSRVLNIQWEHISTITFQIIMLTCQMFMLSFQIFMLTSQFIIWLVTFSFFRK